MKHLSRDYTLRDFDDDDLTNNFEDVIIEEEENYYDDYDEEWEKQAIEELKRLRQEIKDNIDSDDVQDLINYYSDLYKDVYNHRPNMDIFKTAKKINAETSIEFDKNLQPFLTNGADILPLSDEYVKLAKQILVRIPILPTSERIYDIALYLCNYEIEDIENNIDIYVEKVTDNLKERGYLADRAVVASKTMKRLVTAENKTFIITSLEISAYTDQQDFTLYTIAVGETVVAENIEDYDFAKLASQLTGDTVNFDTPNNIDNNSVEFEAKSMYNQYPIYIIFTFYYQEVSE